MSYRVVMLPAAAKALRQLDPHIGARLHGVIRLLAYDPRPPAAKPLVGRPAFRIRVGDYRVIYTIRDDVLLVTVIALGHRRDTYDR